MTTRKPAETREHYRLKALAALDEMLEAKRKHGARSRQYRDAAERYEMARSTMKGATR